MKYRNSHLLRAWINKDDEYFTRLKDVDHELSKHKDQFLNKRVICPCDWHDSFKKWLFFEESEVITNPKDMFEHGTVKKVDISRTFDCLKANYRKTQAIPMAGFVQFLVLHANLYGICSISVSGWDPRAKNRVKFENIDYSKYDLVVTNPPFSKISSFLRILVDQNIDFLIIAPFTVLLRAYILDLFKENRLRIGYDLKLTRFYKQNGSLAAINCLWLTTLPVKRRVKKIICTEEYKTGKYLKYVNFEGIHIPTISMIPKGYDGVMGVPISYLTRHDPSEFEIICSSDHIEKKFRINGRKCNLGVKKDGRIILVFARLLIKCKKKRNILGF